MSLGGFGGPNYGVEWTGESLRYESSQAFGEGREATELVPDPPSWREFWATLDELGFWDWRPDYTDFSVQDGTSWSLEVAREGRRIESRGVNSYPPDPPGPDEPPDERGESGPEESAVWMRFCAAVSQLVGGRPFS